MNDPAGLQPRQASVQLADWSLAHQDQIATAMRLIAAGGRSNDSCLHARQFLDQALSAAGMQTLTSADYRHAAALLNGDQRSLVLGDVMDTLADTDGELRYAVPAWHARYATRPETQPERQAAAQLRAGDVKESGQASRGLDGAWYTRAWYPRSGKPAVVVTSSAMSEEIVNFANTGDAQSWLESRSPAMTGPLRTTATGPTSRTAREEEVLALILRDPQAGMGVAALAGPATWTTHLRAELFAAWRWATAEGGKPGYGVIAATYTRRLLRAPTDAAADIGWPGATRATAYLQRLVATPVTQAQASASAMALAEADTTARAPRPPVGIAPTSRAALNRQLRREERHLLQPPPPLAPGRGSPAPRL
jgi:hypothetical protein